jgi:hypothetical protein
VKRLKQSMGQVGVNAKNVMRAHDIIMNLAEHSPTHAFAASEAISLAGDQGIPSAAVRIAIGMLVKNRTIVRDDRFSGEGYWS